MNKYGSSYPIQLIQLFAFTIRNYPPAYTTSRLTMPLQPCTGFQYSFLELLVGLPHTSFTGRPKMKLADRTDLGIIKNKEIPIGPTRDKIDVDTFPNRFTCSYLARD